MGCRETAGGFRNISSESLIDGRRMTSSIETPADRPFGRLFGVTDGRSNSCRRGFPGGQKFRIAGPKATSNQGRSACSVFGFCYVSVRLMCGGELKVALFGHSTLNREPLDVHLTVRSAFARLPGRVGPLCMAGSSLLNRGFRTSRPQPFCALTATRGS